MKWKEDWEASRKRLVALWDREVLDRCCCSVIVTDPAFREEPMGETQAERRDWYMNPGRIYSRNAARFEKTWFGGDGFPCIWPNLGTCGHAKYLGIRNYKYMEDTIWFEPTISDWETDRLKYDPKNFALLEDEAVLRCLCKLAGDDAFVSMPDNCGNLDALSLLRGPDLLTDFYDEPEAVEEALAVIQAAYNDSETRLFSIIRENNHGGCTHGWMNTWAPGTMAQMQADISVMLSPKLFERFVMPELSDITHLLDYSAYHLDGIEQVRHLDMLLSLEKLNLIQWTSVDGQPDAVNYIDVFNRIQAAGKCLIIYPKLHEIEPLMRALSSRGLYLICRTATSREQGEEIVRTIARLTHD
jgi:hypothetical protein